MFKKRLLTLSMAFIMVASIGFGATGSKAAFAKTTKETTQEETKKELEKVIKIVKSRVVIPENCSELDYNFETDNYGAGSVYNLSWMDNSTGESIQVIADVKGNILNYEHWGVKHAQKIKYLKSELEKTALAAAEKINPSMKGHLTLVSSNYGGKYNNSYEYMFCRTENGLPMDNSVQVAINAETKEITSFYANWLFDAEVPSAKVVISKEKAKEIIKKEVKMELKYLSKYTLKDGKYEQGVYLAYVPTKSYISVDAKTGKVYTTQQEWNITDTSAKGMMDATTEAKADDGREVPLTEKEIEALNKLDYLISEDAAVKLITNNKYLSLDSAAVSVSTHLVHWDDQYYWKIYFEDPKPVDYSKEDYYRASASATVDASKGTIISYYASINDNEAYKEKSLKSVDDCQKKFVAFVDSQDKDLTKNAKLEDKSTQNSNKLDAAEKIPRTIDFRYNRVNEGVVFTGNFFNGGVDRVTGKIYSYSSNWNKDLKFESPKNAMSAEKAMDCYLNLEGFRLAYEQNIIRNYDKGYENQDDYYYNKDAYSQINEIRLVYNTTAIENPNLSPFSGKPLNYEGEEIVERKTNKYEYSDIANHPYERSILLFSDIGFGYEKEKFEPDTLITTDDFLKFMEIAGLYYNEKENTGLSGKNVTRQQAAEYVIARSGFSKVANLKGIFKTDYTDEASISKDALGAVALCKGFNLLQFGKNNTFGPDEKLTRGEAAKLVIDLFSMSEGDFY